MNIAGPKTQLYRLVFIIGAGIGVMGLFYEKGNSTHKPVQILSQPPLPPVSNSIPPFSLTNRLGLSRPIRDLISSPWDTDSFESGLKIASAPSENAETRILALQKLFSKRGSLSKEQLEQFRSRLGQIVRDTSVDPLVRSTGVHVLADLIDFLESKGFIAKSDITEGDLFVEYAKDSSLDRNVRGAAIRAVGSLNLSSGRATVEELLRDHANVNVPELSRNGCLALLKLSSENAFPLIQGVLQNTSDATTFGTAAFCLGQMKTAEAMSALVEQSTRFPDSPSVDAALVNLSGTILKTLNSRDSRYLLSAIQATQHLWKDGQREDYAARLRTVVAEGPLAARRAACERLLDMAGRLPFAQEKHELSVILESIGQNAELRDYADHIQQRMSATVLTPIAEAP